MVEEIMNDDQAEREDDTRGVSTQEFTSIDDMLKLPRDLNEEWTAEGCLAIFLPKQATTEVSKLEEELADLKKLLELQDKKLQGTSATDAVATKKRLATIEKSIEKAGDPTAKAALAA